MAETADLIPSLKTERRVLIIDDDVDFAVSLAEIVTSNGYHVRLAHNADESIRSLQETEAEVAIVDVSIGDDNGVELVRSLRRIQSDIQCILLTAYASTDSVIDALHVGVYDYLRKPTSPKSFLLTLDHCFESIALRKEKAEAEIELAERNAELENINNRLRNIVETAKNLTMSVRSDDLDSRLLQAVADNMAATGGSLFYIRDTNLELAHALDPGHAPVGIPLGDLRKDCFFYRALHEREPILVSDVSETDACRSGWSGYSDGSAVIFPLLMDDEPIGVISLHNRVELPFTRQDLDLGRIIISLITEVLRERRVSQTLQKSEYRFRKLVEQSTDLVTVIDGEGIFLYESPSAHALLGWEPGALLDTNVLDLVHPDDKKGLHRIIEQGRKNPEEPLHLVHQVRCRNGQYLVFESHIRNLVDDAEIRGYVINSRDVTARTELADRLQTIFDQAPMAFVLTSKEGGLVDLNQAAAELIGGERKDILDNTTSLVDLVQDEELDRFRNLLKKSTAGLPTGPDELTVCRPDGSCVVVEIFTRLVRINSEEFLLSSARDITEQHTARQALQKSEERYRGVVETTFDTLLVSQDREIKWLNKQTLDMVGVEDFEKIVGTSLLDWMTESDSDEFGDLFVPAQVNGTAVGPVEVPVVRHDGSAHFVEWRVYPTEFNGKPALMHVGRDIHERRSAERLLRESEERYRTLFENAEDGIALIGGEHYIDCNPAMCRIFGLSREEIIGRTPFEISPDLQPGGIDSRETGLKRLMAVREGRQMHFDWQHIRRDGSIVDTEIFLGPIQLNNKTYIQAILRDITERRLAEERERQHHNQLFQAAKMASLGTLVSGVAHEINNPNNFIRLSTENLADMWPEIVKLLRKMNDSSEPVFIKGIALDAAEEIVDSIISGLNEGSVRIERLVQSLKEYSRKDAGAVHQEVDLNDVVETAHTIVKSVVMKATRRYSFTRNNDIPKVMGNFHQIEQVVINLLTNACQALSSTDEAVRVITDFDSESRRVSVSVEDEGMGISEEDMLQLTDPFFTTKRDIGGTGLGLSVSQRIVQGHGGELQFDSIAGQGTTVVLSLPAG